MMDNEDRAWSVQEYLIKFADEMGLKPDLDADGPVTVAGDMICNILHWVAQNHPEGYAAALDAARSGLGHFSSEFRIDYDADDVDELGPEADVQITIRCDGEYWQSETFRGTQCLKAGA